MKLGSRPFMGFIQIHWYKSGTCWGLVSSYDLLIFNLDFLHYSFQMWRHVVALIRFILVSVWRFLAIDDLQMCSICYFWVIVISCHCTAFELSILCFPFKSLMWLIMSVCYSCQWGRDENIFKTLFQCVPCAVNKPRFISNRRTFHFLFSVLYQILSLKSVVLQCHKNST